MSAQRFGAVYFDDTTKATWLGLMNGEPLYDKTAVIHICNHSSAIAQVSLAYMINPTAVEPELADYILFYKNVSPTETITLPALAVSSVGRIVVYSTIVGVSAIAQGYQDEI